MFLEHHWALLSDRTRVYEKRPRGVEADAWIKERLKLETMGFHHVFASKFLGVQLSFFP
jgi:hypothetical protein